MEPCTQICKLSMKTHPSLSLSLSLLFLSQLAIKQTDFLLTLARGGLPPSQLAQPGQLGQLARLLLLLLLLLLMMVGSFVILPPHIVCLTGCKNTARASDRRRKRKKQQQQQHIVHVHMFNCCFYSSSRLYILSVCLSSVCTQKGGFFLLAGTDMAGLGRAE